MTSRTRTRLDVAFSSAGDECRGWLFMPDAERPPLDIERQLADWAAALAYARSLDGIDSERIALWGTSFGGGHVIEAAARDGAVAAVVSQCPFTDGLAVTRAAS